MSVKRSSWIGFTLIAAGVSAAVWPFVAGGWTSDWHIGRFLLTIVPGAMAVTGGLLILGRRPQLVSAGGAVALAGGLWFVAAPLVYAAFVGPEIGTLGSGTSVRMLQWSPFFLGVGAFVGLLSAHALGLLAPLEFEAAATQPATPGRARVPLPPARPRRQRVVQEPVRSSRAGSKGSRSRH